MVSHYIARRVADIFYSADYASRHMLVNNYLEYNERSYMGSMMGMAGYMLSRTRIFNRPLNIHLSVRDNTSYDGLFVFRVGNKVKIGICESKMLRYQNRQTNQNIALDHEWDTLERNGRSHFFKQTQAFNKWSPDVARWYMFILDQDVIKLRRANLGSLCVWHSELSRYIKRKKINDTYLWRLQDVDNMKAQYDKRLWQIIYDILSCNEGKPKTLVAGSNFVTVEIQGENPLRIPIPRKAIKESESNLDLQQTGEQEVLGFLRQYNLSFYEYIELQH